MRQSGARGGTVYEPAPTQPIPIGPKQITALIGAAVLLIGVFLPIVGGPGFASVNYWFLGTTNGKVMIVLALLSSALVWFNRYEQGLWVTGGLALAVVVWDAIYFGHDLGLNHLRFGWIVMIPGALMILVAAFVPDFKRGNSNARGRWGEGRGG